MPRIARVVVPGFAHHVTQRGNNRQDVFFTDDDRRFYLRTLGEQARLHGVKLLAYCLMTNHVHVVVVPPDAQSLELAVGRTHWRYSQAINRLHRRSGHLWQGRFFSCPLDDACQSCQDSLRDEEIILTHLPAPPCLASTTSYDLR